MRVFEDFLCAEETFAICEHEMCVDAVVDANMFVFDRDVYISGLFFVLNFTRNEWEREKVLFLGFALFLSQIFDPNTWQPFLTTFHICASQQKGVVVVVVACTFNEHDERDDDDDDDACERKF